MIPYDTNVYIPSQLPGNSSAFSRDEPFLCENALWNEVWGRPNDYSQNPIFLDILFNYRYSKLRTLASSRTTNVYRHIHGGARAKRSTRKNKTWGHMKGLYVRGIIKVTVADATISFKVAFVFSFTV